MPNDFEFLEDDDTLNEPIPPAPAPKQDAPVNRRQQDQERFNQQLQNERQQYQQPAQPQADPADVDRYVDGRAQAIAAQEAQRQAELQLAVYKTEQKHPELTSPETREWVASEARRLFGSEEGKNLSLEQGLDQAAQNVKARIQQLAQSNQKPIDRLAIDMGVTNSNGQPKTERLTVGGIKSMSDADFKKLDEQIMAQR